MRKSFLKIICLFIFASSGCLAFNADQPEQTHSPKLGARSKAGAVFVFSPTLIRQFKENINRAIQHDHEGRKHVRISTKDFFDTAARAIESIPQPYVGPCYLSGKANQLSLRTVGTTDSHYARTLALLIRIFPPPDIWSFELARSNEKQNYRFVRTQVLQKAKSYLLAWSRRMLQEDHLIPGVTPKLADCPGETKSTMKARQGMEVSILAYSFVSVYELLYPYLSANEKTGVALWLKQLKSEVIEGRKYWKTHIAYYRTNFSSQLTFHLMGLIAIAAATGDQDLMAAAINGGNSELVDTKYLKSMIEGAVYMESECSGARYKTNPVCLIFKRRFALGSRTNEIKRYPKIAKIGCQKKHYRPKHHFFPQTGELYDRKRRLDKIKGSCAGKGMYYAMNHLKNLTILTLSAELNGYAMKDYVGKNGEALSLAYQFYGNCLAEIHKNNVYVSDSIEACEYYKRNRYPKKRITAFHLAYHLWRLNTPQIKRILTKQDQEIDLLNPLGFLQILGFKADI